MRAIISNVYTTPEAPSHTHIIQRTNQQQQIKLRTKQNCELAISWFPRFNYNAVGGGCQGLVKMEEQKKDKYTLYFDPTKVCIPNLNWITTRVMGIVPLPPLLFVAIRPQKFQGWWNRENGEAEMNLVAEFDCCIGNFYKSPPLLVDVPLTTQTAQGVIHQGDGRFIQQGKGKLAGVTVVPKTGDILVDTVLGLPCEALAFMEIELELLD
eukprot:TRINITY_DN17966_c1_g2_i2.p3 TRINITY_DN17966_c1_g2~~TRINITY_DN17966_c1_g2_i2.p3  ORF type:complete len:210 (+),score=31.33 TRINITY_DN17966_c1_g2_i2:234-863(+)